LLEVKWPATGRVEQFTDVGVNQIVEIQEGSGIVRTTPFANGGGPDTSKASR
jgi:hypothetical protein